MPLKKKPFSTSGLRTKNDPLPPLQQAPKSKPQCSCKADHLAKIKASEFTVDNDKMIIENLRTLENEMNLRHLQTITDLKENLGRCKEREDHYEDELRSVNNQLAVQFSDFLKKTEVLEGEKIELLRFKIESENSIQSLEEIVNKHLSTIKEIEDVSDNQHKEIEELRSQLSASYVCHTNEIREKLKRLKDIEDLSTCQICNQ